MGLKYISGFILLVLALSLTEVRAQDPEISEAILPDVKRSGTTGILRCVVMNQLHNSVYWVHKATQMVLSRDDKIIIDEYHNNIVNGYPKYMVFHSMEELKDVYELVISRLESRDAGLYTCQIPVVGTDRVPSRDGEMVVVYPPAIIQSLTTNTLSVKELAPINITCAASGFPNPNITWVRVSAAVLPNGYLRFQNSYLSVPSINHTDRGVYRCLADNNVRPAAYFDTTVYVYFKPNAKPVQSSYGQAENRMFDVTIECTIAGWPEPELQWYKVNQGGNWDPIMNSDFHTVNILLNHANILEPQERWFQLVIRSVTANDYGDYICSGKNDQGEGHATVNLFYTSECQGPNCPPEQQPEYSLSRMLTPDLLLITYILTTTCLVLPKL